MKEMAYRIKKEFEYFIKITDQLIKQTYSSAKHDDVWHEKMNADYMNAKARILLLIELSIED